MQTAPTTPTLLRMRGRWDVPYNLERLVGLVRQAAAATPSPDLILAPEGILEGYPVMDIRSGDVAAEHMRTVAFTDDSPPIARLRALAAELRVCLAFGYAEQVGDEIFNCAAFVDHTGAICGKYHKLQLAEGHVDDGSCWYNAVGAHGRAFDTPLGRVGFLICNDRWNSVTRRPRPRFRPQFCPSPPPPASTAGESPARLVSLVCRTWRGCPCWTARSCC